MPYPTPDQVSERSRLVAALFAWFLGIFGVHRFYVGKTGTGILMICTLGGLGIWALVDFVMILAGVFTDDQGKRLWVWVEPGSVEGRTSA